MGQGALLSRGGYLQGKGGSMAKREQTQPFKVFSLARKGHVTLKEAL